MEVQDPRTIGISPKAIGAALAALAAPYIVGLLARLVGLELDVGTVTAIVGPPLIAIAAAGAAALARVGIVRITDRPVVTELGASGQLQGQGPAGGLITRERGDAGDEGPTYT